MLILENLTQNANIVSQWHACAAFCLTIAASWGRRFEHEDIDTGECTITPNRLTRVENICEVWRVKGSWSQTQNHFEGFATLTVSTPVWAIISFNTWFTPADSLCVQTTTMWVAKACFPWQLEETRKLQEALRLWQFLLLWIQTILFSKLHSLKYYFTHCSNLPAHL